MVRYVLCCLFLLGVLTTGCVASEGGCYDDECCSEGDVRCKGLNAIVVCGEDSEQTVYECGQVCLDAGFEETTGCEYDYGWDQDVCLCL